MRKAGANLIISQNGANNQYLSELYNLQHFKKAMPSVNHSLQASNHSNSVSVGWVLRDMMQSTGVWTFERHHIEQLTKQALAIGFDTLEIGGGQSYQIALQAGFNPYQLIRFAKKVIEKETSDKDKYLQLQVLLRGANQLGFKHYTRDIQRRNIDLLIDAGGDTDKNKTVIVRNFDALNDPENLRFSIEHMVGRDLEAAQLNNEAKKNNKTPTAKRVHIQAALSYVQPKSEDADTCYSTQYFLNYAKALQSIAKDAGGQIDSFCIKDMSGQLIPKYTAPLIQQLKTLGRPVYLHCHSTDEARSLAVQATAIENGIDGVEVAIEPLSGGASHNDVEYIVYLDNIKSLDLEEIKTTKTLLNTIFGDKALQRKDMAMPLNLLKALVALGIPGGAIPFIVNDLRVNVCKMLDISLHEAFEAFKTELDKIQNELGNVPLVTPTADIIAKQTIKVLGNQKRADNYKLMDPRFCNLVLGHYGKVINHANNEIIEPSERLVNEIKIYCEKIKPDEQGKRKYAGRFYPEPFVLEKHPTETVESNSYDEELIAINDLYEKYPESCNLYGTKEECYILQVMRPAGNNHRLVTQNILHPTEERLRYILQQTLNLLPDNRLPQSRKKDGDEETDLLLLERLGDYDGIIANIKDLVVNKTDELIKDRISNLMKKIIDPLEEEKNEVRKNRYYVERRFIGLFAAAVFWDLKRVCRRTGNNPNKGINDMTITKLDIIISLTLKKRQLKGIGKAKEFLS